jgi:carboxyl-terminal processing protease
MKFRFCLLALLFSLTYPVSGLNLSKGESGRIARLVGQILSSNHLRQEALNNRLSELALDNYLDALDVNHQVFIKPDIEEFREKYSDKLDDLTLAERNAQPAFAIYKRYIERLEARVNDVDELLAAEHDFEKEESLELKRSKKPWPNTVEELNELWRKRIKSDLLQGRLQKEDAETVTERLKKRYSRLLKSMKELEGDEILQIYLSAIGAAYDPHSNYMSPSEAENFQIHSVKLKLSGIGALLRSEDGYCKIVSLVPGGPALMGEQIKPNDRIIAVAQGDDEPVDVIEMKLNKVVDLIRGERGTEVRLTVIPASSADGSERNIVSIIRDVIQLKEQQAKAKIIDLPRADEGKVRLGVIDLPQYYEHCARDVRQIINRLKLEEVDGMVLDLRRNGGGILDEAVKLTGLFFQKGPVVQVRDFQNSVTVLSDKDPRVAYDGPLIVLVSRLSASASEITAAALQDYGRAIVIGDEATHGKGTVQTLQDLNRFMRRVRGAAPKNSGMLKYTISNFYRVEGTTTQKYGVKPDIVLPSVYDYMEIGEEHLPNSLEPDKIPSAKFQQLDRAKSYVEDLKENSQKRVDQSTDFGYVKADIARYLELKERESISLNESVRITETEEDKDRSDVRKTEREARPEPNESVFLLTLDATKNAEELVLLPYLAANEAETEEEKKDDDSEEADPAESEETEKAEEEDEATRPYDPHLREALNILSDYINALKKAPPVDSNSNLS